MQDHKAVRAAELLRQHCRGRCCENENGRCVFWDDVVCQCSLMGVRSPGHFPVEDIRQRARQRQDSPAVVSAAPVPEVPRRSRRDAVAERFVLED